MLAKVTILENNFETEYDFKITAHGAIQSFTDPAEAAEFELEVLAIFSTDGPQLELPPWLRDLIVDHLSNRDDIIAIVNTADQEGDQPGDDL